MKFEEFKDNFDYIYSFSSHGGERATFFKGVHTWFDNNSGAAHLALSLYRATTYISQINYYPFMRTYLSQCGGFSSLPPSLTNFMTSEADFPGYGVEPRATISHMSTPNDQTSDLVVQQLSYRDSGDIQLKVVTRKEGNQESNLETIFCILLFKAYYIRYIFFLINHYTSQVFLFRNLTKADASIIKLPNMHVIIDWINVSKFKHSCICSFFLIVHLSLC